MSTTCSRSSGGSLAVARRPRRRASIARFVAAWLLVLAAGAAPFAVTAREAGQSGEPAILLAAPPDETCLPQATGAQGGFDLCSPPATPAGGSSFNLGGILPIVGALVLGAGLALVVAYLVLRREPARPSTGRRRRVGTCRKCGGTTWSAALAATAAGRGSAERLGLGRSASVGTGTVRAIRSRARKNSPTTGRNHGRPSYGAGTSGKRSFERAGASPPPIHSAAFVPSQCSSTTPLPQQPIGVHHAAGAPDVGLRRTHPDLAARELDPVAGDLRVDVEHPLL